MRNYNSLDYIKKLTRKVTPKLKYDPSKDHDEWKKEAKAKLIEILGLDLFEKPQDDKFTVLEENKRDGYKEIRFEYQSEEDYFVPGAICIPDNINGKLPAVICLQGHSTGMHVSLGQPKFDGDVESIEGGRDFCVQAIKEGFVALCLDQRYMGLAGSDEKGDPSCITKRESTATYLLGRTPIGERVWDIQRLIDVIENHFDNYVDTSKIVCLGNSGGGTATFYASCVEERIALSIPSCAVSTYDDSIVDLSHCACNYLFGIRRYFNMGDLGCLIAPRKYIQVNGVLDRIFPIEPAKETFNTIYSSYKKLGVENYCHHVIGSKGHQFYPDEAWPIVHDIL